MKYFIVFAALVLMGCVSCKRSEKPAEPRQEDLQAKKMLQGIWISADDDSPVLMAKGDCIFYPDSTSMPVAYKIISDTLFLSGATETSYAIERQTEHLFQFRNQNGDLVRLVKSEDASDFSYFDSKPPVVLNQRRLIKRDTIVAGPSARYHCYVQVNPTTYKVIKTSYNDEGMEVGNVYYDNTVHFAIFIGAQRLYSHDFRKQDFQKLLPMLDMKQAILSDMEFEKTDESGIHYHALLGIPDTATSYMVEVSVSYQGKLSMKLAE